jgi:hypothetical protein
MNDEQKYNASLEQAKKELKTCGSMDCDAARLIFRLFPQLRESEDERIRKSLIEFLTDIKEISESGRITWAVRKEDVEMCKSSIAYLEKQKEQKPDLELIQRSWYMEGYTDGEFKREPMWNLVTGKGGPRYEKNEKYGQPLEQKPADDKAFEEWIDGWYNEHHRDGYITMDEREFKNFCRGIRNMYQQKPAEWSEEDKALFGLLHQCVCRCVNDDRMIYSERERISKTMFPFIEKLQALRSQPKQEWSEEDKQWLESIIQDYEDSLVKDKDHAAVIKVKIDFLKSLRPSWKPSEEKMKVPKGVPPIESIQK